MHDGGSKMVEKRKIKIVKREQAATLKGKRVPTPKPSEAARKMVANVSGWVTDLKQRKTTETKAAFEMLFKTVPHANES